MNPIVVFVLFGVGIVVAAILAARQAAKRREALQQWSRRTGLAWRRGPDRGIENRYPLHKCFREGSDRYAENVMEGERDGRRICCFDYHYETYSTNSKGQRQTHHHRFSAVVFETGLPLKHLSLRPEGFFDKITEFVGWDDIDFELSEFSRAFYVKAPDRKWAFDVFPQATMEFLLAQPRFHVEMAGPWLMVRRTNRFQAKDFDGALAVGEGILDRLPRYLLRELKGEDR